MSYKVGDIVEGKITHIKPYAFFLKFDEQTRGLLHISEISNSFIKDIERYGEIGKSLKVKILEIDEKDNFLRVSYKKVEDNPPLEKKNSALINDIRADKQEFKAVEEKIPEWIENTLKKMEENK